MLIVNNVAYLRTIAVCFEDGSMDIKLRDLYDHLPDSPNDFDPIAIQFYKNRVLIKTVLTFPIDWDEKTIRAIY